MTTQADTTQSRHSGPLAFGQPAHRRPVRLLVAVTVAVLCLPAACTGSDDPKARKPAAAHDYWPTHGWRTAAPADHGVDPALPGRIDRQAAAIPELRSVLVVRGGYLVVGRYYGGATATAHQPVFSVTKSVTSALVGIALREGHLHSLQQTVGELLADKLPADADPRMATVTVQQLLTMTSGLPPDPDNRPVGMLASRDWVRFVLGRRLLHDPGEVFAYSTEGSQLLSAIVATSSGQTTLAFARHHLFGPLGIATQPAAEPVDTPENLSVYLRAGFAWARDPQGYHIGGGTLKLTSPDLAKLGYLYLNQGRWDRTQVVPADYVGASTRTHSAGRDNASYGYHWWVETVRDHAAFFAQGAAGQFIEVVPDLDLVAVVTTSGERPLDRSKTLINSLIVPAVKQ